MDDRKSIERRDSPRFDWEYRMKLLLCLAVAIFLYGCSAPAQTEWEDQHRQMISIDSRLLAFDLDDPSLLSEYEDPPQAFIDSAKSVQIMDDICVDLLIRHCWDKGYARNLPRATFPIDETGRLVFDEQIAFVDLRPIPDIHLPPFFKDHEIAIQVDRIGGGEQLLIHMHFAIPPFPGDQKDRGTVRATEAEVHFECKHQQPVMLTLPFAAEQFFKKEDVPHHHQVILLLKPTLIKQPLESFHSE